MHTRPMCPCWSTILVTFAAMHVPAVDMAADEGIEGSRAPIEDSVDAVEGSGRHVHVWIVHLDRELSPRDLRGVHATVIFGPGCGPPASPWKRLAAGSLLAGAAGLGKGISPIAAGASSALLTPPARRVTLKGRKLTALGAGWYALSFPCQHDGGSIAPTARLFIRLPGEGRRTETSLITPWRPL